MKVQEILIGQVWRVEPPVVESMITGVARAGFFPDGKVTLVYTDGETESAVFSIEEAQALADKAEEHIFAVVSAVQSKARESKGPEDE